MAPGEGVPSPPVGAEAAAATSVLPQPQPRLAARAEGGRPGAIASPRHQLPQRLPPTVTGSNASPNGHSLHCPLPPPNTSPPAAPGPSQPHPNDRCDDPVRDRSGREEAAAATPALPGETIDLGWGRAAGRQRVAPGLSGGGQRNGSEVFPLTMAAPSFPPGGGWLRTSPPQLLPPPAPAALAQPGGSRRRYAALGAACRWSFGPCF
ncbi:uncharacterized protein LOC142600393 [Balearica regulorum gibbericeps]|uniref:uncharacterized protein LOC142600393 n=1 Tax=Balearica regulorum gibbericeps TaxID=100784 RepID=UPI003F5E793B